MKKYILLGALVIFIICCLAWYVDYEPYTEEDYAAYLEYQASLIREYEIVSVHQYIAVSTNQFGKVTDRKLVYCFTYIDDNGKLCQVDEFYHTEYGMWKVYVGDKNRYVVKKGDSLRCLYLTEETLKNMPFE